MLQVAGVNFEGWTGVTVSDSLENASTAFAFGMVWRFPLENNPIRVRPGDRCAIWFGDDLVATGYVDTCEPSGDAESTEVTVTGRSSTQDLIDCSADPGSFAGLKIEEIGNKLAAPYGVTVVAQVDTGAVFGRKSRKVKVPFYYTFLSTFQDASGPALAVAVPDGGVKLSPDHVPKFISTPAVVGHTVQVGETVFESVSRLAVKRSLLVTDDAAGRLVLTRAGTGRASTIIRRGDNVLKGSAKFDASKVYSEIVVRGQSAGTDDVADDDCVTAAGMATDPDLFRLRRLVLRAQGHTSPADCLAEAQWEARNRLGKSCTAEYTVAGWRQADGTLWRKNLIVVVDDPLCGLSGEMLIVAVEYKLEVGKGRTTALKLSLAAAFIPKPIPGGKSKGAARAPAAFWQEIGAGVAVRGAGPSAAQLRAAKGKPKPIAVDPGDGEAGLE